MRWTVLVLTLCLAGCEGCGSFSRSHLPGVPGPVYYYYPAYPPANQFVVECGEADEKAGEGEYRKLRGKIFRLVGGEQGVMDGIRCSRLQITVGDLFDGWDIWEPGIIVRVLDAERITVTKKSGIDVAEGKANPQTYESSYLVLELQRLDTKKTKLWIQDLCSKKQFMENWKKMVNFYFEPVKVKVVKEEGKE